MTTKNTKKISHGDWIFDYNSYINIYDNIIDDTNNNFDDKLFIHTKSTNKNDNNNCLTNKDLDDFRRAALIHKIARKKALDCLYTGGKLADLVDIVENTILKLCKQDPKTYFLKGNSEGNISGIAFPVGVNINNVVAHDSKTKMIVDDRTFLVGDVVKVDIGVHINGRIIDSAFTHIITDKPGITDNNNIYNDVLSASREATFVAIKMAGPDQRLVEISESISEIIKSYEVHVGNDVIPIKPVQGIGGHNIKQYTIHGGKLLLSEPDHELQDTLKMEDDEIYAIETYASTGNGIMTQNSSLEKCTHYMEADKETIESNKAITKKDKKFFRKTDFYEWLQTRNGLPFSNSWLDAKEIPKIEKALKLGIPSGQLIAYPPLYDTDSSVVAQFEHTIHIKDGSVEIFSLGEDY